MKKFLSLVLALVMTMSLVTVSAGAKDFTDDSKITYQEAVDVMSAVGVIDGYTDGSFQPTTNLTRGAAAKIICNLILGPTTAAALGADTAPYSDVPVSNVFSGYIAYCQKEGIISGYADGTFRPSAPLTGYAFMKMLLGALGYDGSKEGYTGANWSVNVAKQAIAIGLNKGNDEFVGQASVNREEAMLYAFNAMQADLVEYGNETTITVGDVTVETSGKAQSVTWGNSADKVNNIKQDQYVQFAERYFPELKLVAGTDDFARPANIWTVKADKVGTYAKTPDATYSKNVALGDIYADLGMTIKDQAEVYINGKPGDDVVVSKANDLKVADDNQNEGLVGTGSTVEVYRDTETNDVTICVIDTYAGTVAKTVAAKGNKDRYIVVSPESTVPNGFISEFTTEEEFDDDAVVLFTYSESAKEIKSVAVAESVNGTVTKVVNKKENGDINKSLTIGDTEYKAAFKVAGETLNNVSVNNDYTVYLDTYGNAIYVVEEELSASDYALVLETASKSDFVGNKASLVFADGTTKIVETAKNYNAAGDNHIDNFTIVSYKVDDDGVYTLRPVSAKQADGTKHETVDAENLVANDFVMKNDKASIQIKDSPAEAVTANSKSVIVVRDTKDQDSWTSYTGIKNAPSIESGAALDKKDIDVYYFCKSGSMVTVMFILPNTGVLVEDDNNTMLFLAGESVSGLNHDSQGDYFIYNAVVNGEITTVKVDENVANADSLNGLYASYSTDKYGIITRVTGYATYNNTDAKSAVVGAGVDKRSADYTVVLDTDDTNVTLTVDENAAYYYVDKDGEITESSYRAIVKDGDDKVYAAVKDYLVQALFIESVGDETTDTAELTKEVQVRNVDLSTGTISYYVENGKVALSDEDILAILQDKGCTDISKKTGEWTYTTKSGLTYTQTITQDQLYKVTIGSKTYEVSDGTSVTAAAGLADLTGTNAKIIKTADNSFTFSAVSGLEVPEYDCTIEGGYESWSVASNISSVPSNATGATIATTATANGGDYTKPQYVKTGDKVKVDVAISAANVTGNGIDLATTAGTVANGHIAAGSQPINQTIEVTLGEVNSTVTITLTATDTPAA